MINKDTNTHDRENDPVSRLLGSLKRVEAPHDFDFRVKARIAQGRPANRTVSWIPVSVRYAVPLVLLLLIGSYVGFNSFFASDDLVGQTVGEVKPADSKPAVIEPIVEPVPTAETGGPTKDLLAGQTGVKPENVTGIKKKREKTVTTLDPRTERRTGGSYVEAIRPSINFTPVGNESNANPPANNSIPINPRPTAKEFLALIGIQASSAGPGGRLISVSGAAARAGAQVGDVIESVNIHGRSVWVRRNGRSVEIVLD